MTNWGEIGVETLIPLNGAAVSGIGVVGMVHVFFDYLFPNTIGKPISPDRDSIDIRLRSWPVRLTNATAIVRRSAMRGGR